MQVAFLACSMAEQAAVMYAGEVVEQSLVGSLIETLCYPYTIGLIASIPIIGEVKRSITYSHGRNLEMAQ